MYTTGRWWFIRLWGLWFALWVPVEDEQPSPIVWKLYQKHTHARKNIFSKCFGKKCTSMAFLQKKNPDRWISSPKFVHGLLFPHPNCSPNRFPTAKNSLLGASGCLDDTERGEGEINNPPEIPRVLGERFLTQVSWRSSTYPPARNKGLIAGLIKGKPMVNKPLIRPYSWWGVG